MRLNEFPLSSLSVLGYSGLNVIDSGTGHAVGGRPFADHASVFQ